MKKNKNVVEVSYTVKSLDGYLTDQKRNFPTFTDAMKFVRIIAKSNGVTFYGKPVIN